MATFLCPERIESPINLATPPFTTKFSWPVGALISGVLLYCLLFVSFVSAPPPPGCIVDIIEEATDFSQFDLSYKPHFLLVCQRNNPRRMLGEHEKSL